MASVQIVHQWADGDVTIVTATGKASYPQVMSELKVTAVDAFSDAVALLIVWQDAPK